jgi:hypothetical protein
VDQKLGIQFYYHSTKNRKTVALKIYHCNGKQSSEKACRYVRIYPRQASGVRSYTLKFGSWHKKQRE